VRCASSLKVVFALEADDMDFVGYVDARRDDALRIRSDAKQKLAAVFGNQWYHNVLEGMEGSFLLLIQVHELREVELVELRRAHI
jgi:hypothetical protein